MEQLLILLRNTVLLIRWQDILDILLVAFLLYKVFGFFRDTNGAQLLRGIAVILIFTQIVGAMKLNVTYYILSSALQIGILALVVLFQPELRRMLDSVGRNRLTNLFTTERESEETKTMRTISQLVETSMYMSSTRTGMLLVIEREGKLGDIIRNGTTINADVGVELLKNIFYNKAPLHDGAVIIRGDKIVAAGCVLPLSANRNLSVDLGTRHRAAVGISEQCDSVSLIVSEETGAISVAINGMLKRNLTPATLTAILNNELVHPKESKTKREKWVALLGGKRKK